MEELNKLKQEIDNYIYHLNDDGAYDLYKKIKKNKNVLQQSEPEDKLNFIKLKFLVIPFLLDREIIDLFRENIAVGLNIKDLDLKERINKKLLFMDLEDRDDFKSKIKNALISSQAQITKEVVNNREEKIKKVNDWIKDYQTEIEGKNQALVEAQYFQNNYIKDLKESEINNLKKLFDFYKFLNVSSKNPEGFEDDLLARDEKGRIVTTQKGKVVVLYDPNSEKEGEENKNTGNEEVDKLQKEIDKYPEGSIERKALEEELNKMQQKS